MKILYVIVLLLLEIKTINGIKEYNIASMVDVKSSSVLVYGGFNYSATNVIDGNPSTLPDECNCCWSSSNEQNPWLEVTLPQFEFVERIVIQGKTDGTDDPRLLSGLNLQIDGIIVDETSLKYDSVKKRITVDLQNRRFKVMMLRRPGTSDPWFIIICEILIYIQVDTLFERLRHTAITSQSSIFTNKDDFNSSKAIDGKNIDNIDTCMCCSVTDNDVNSPISWWQINLGNLYIAYGLEIFGRNKTNKGDNKQLQNASIFAGNSTLESIEKQTTLLYRVPTITTSTHFVHHLRNPVIAQFLKVQVMNKVLSLCEIILYGRGYCNVGRFGPSCKSECHCADNKVCHPWTGQCETTGCLPGWQGQACSETCHLGRYGVNCSSYCSIHCLNGKQQCDSSSGVCKQGCKAGYMGRNCSTACLDGLYGPDCNDSCSNLCKNVTPRCNKASGMCTQGCKPGYDGAKCISECHLGSFGENCSGRCNCINSTDCRKNDGYCTRGCAFGWKGLSCSVDSNLIRRIYTNVTTSQSSTYSHNNNPQDFNSEKAIDGKQNYSIDSCKCCSVTDGTSSSWWHIDLKQKYLIDVMQIFGRQSGENWQLENATIYAGNASVVIGSTANMTSIYNVPSMSNRIYFTKHLDPTIARYFLVQLSQPILTICEFKLFEKECDIGYFGTGCMHNCHCSDNKTCNQITGKCQVPGCLAGWQGEACDTVCDTNKFGNECKNTCNCVNGTACLNTNGTCFLQRCDPGWLLPTCSEDCQDRQFGDGCNDTCHCKDGTSCNHISGQCDTGLCEPGWLLPTCSKVCDNGTFGYNCSSVCHCYKASGCNAANGECDIGTCDPGWTSSSCDKKCNHRMFGDNCSSVCHCYNGAGCDAVNGECDIGKCDPGWSTSTCNKRENLIEKLKLQIKTQMSSEAENTNSTLAVDGLIGPDPDTCHCCSITSNSPLSWWLLDLGKRFPLSTIQIYGRNKENSYQHLVGFKLLLFNDSIENTPDIFMDNESLHAANENRYDYFLRTTIARYIKIQRPGVLTICEVVVIEGSCKDGTFGEECLQNCHCADNKSCDRLHGYCQFSLCKLGWTGKACNESCPENTFGEGCSQVCNCQAGTCSTDYGVCPDGESKIDYYSASMIGGLVAGIVVVIAILVLICVVIYRYRLKPAKRNESENYYKSINRNRMHNDDVTTYDTIDISQEHPEQANGVYENENITGL